MNENTKINNSKKNGTKALSVAVLVIAIIAGVYAMVEPMQQRIDFLERQVLRSENLLQKHADVKIHPGASEEVAAMRERFKEVETQFKGLREVLQLQIEDMSRRQSAHEARDQTGPYTHKSLATHLERIKALERAVYGKQ